MILNQCFCTRRWVLQVSTAEGDVSEIAGDECPQLLISPRERVVSCGHSDVFMKGN